MHVTGYLADKVDMVLVWVIGSKKKILLWDSAVKQNPIFSFKMIGKYQNMENVTFGIVRVTFQIVYETFISVIFAEK